MDWDQALFRLLFKGLRAVTRRDAGAGEAPGAVPLEALGRRLEILACALAGERLALREAEGAGGWAGDLVYLPARLDFAGTPERNALAYVYRVGYAVASRRAGLVLPPGGDAPWRPALATALAAAPTARGLEEDLPAARRLRLELSAHALATRPALEALAPPVAAVEALVQVRLGAPPDELRRRLPEPLAAWLDRALAAGPDDTDALGAGLGGWRWPAGAAVPPVPLWGLLMPEAAPEAGAGAPRPGASPDALSSGTERKGRRKDRVEQVVLDEDKESDNPLVHSFEKVHTAEEYRGGKKALDGADELAAHQEALDELDLREVIRTTERARSLYRVDAMFDSGAGDLADGAPAGVPAATYDEWDAKARRYKPGWCHVYVERPRTRPEHGLAPDHVREVQRRHARTIRELRKELEKIALDRAWRTRQLDGPEVDVDQVVDWHATLRSGHSPPARLYMERRRRDRDVATLVLLDTSLSSDAWHDGRRVLDVARDSVLILGQVLSELQDRFGVAGFHSHTRRDCRFVPLKGFAEDWRAARPRLLGLEPTGYTRIGPALRHARHVLAGTHARRKLLLLVSDSKPTDYDRYEGRYGMEDVRQALRELGREDVHFFALAVARRAEAHLPAMYGRDGYALLSRPDELARSMARLYEELAR